jgi:hypothetical protein
MTIIVNGSNTPTAGAVGYGDGTNLAFTSAGTTGQFLSSNGSSAPSWVAAPSGAMTLISTQTSGYSWTGLSGYNKYLLMYSNMQLISNGDKLLLQVGYGSTPTYITSGYYGGYYYQYYSGSSNFSGTGNHNITYVPIGNFGNNVTTTGSVSGYVYIQGMTSTSFFSFNGQSASNDATSNTSEASSYSYSVVTSNSGTAIKIYFPNGTSSGTASLYGISS